MRGSFKPNVKYSIIHIPNTTFYIQLQPSPVQSKVQPRQLFNRGDQPGIHAAVLVCTFVGLALLSAYSLSHILLSTLHTHTLSLFCLLLCTLHTLS